MGQAAAKELQETPLGEGTLHKEDSQSIAPSLVTKVAVTKLKNSGKKWIDEASGDVLWTVKSKGLIRSHGLIEDSDGKEIAKIVTEKSGLNTITNFVCKSTPAYEGQTPLTADELKKANIEEGTELYKFSMIDTVRKLSTAKSTYSIVTGKDTYQELYTAEKLSSMGFLALFKAGDVVVAKASTPGFSMTPCVEAAIGVDLLAIICIGTTLASNDNSAGALAGAGVV